MCKDRIASTLERLFLTSRWNGFLLSYILDLDNQNTLTLQFGPYI